MCSITTHKVTGVEKVMLVRIQSFEIGGYAGICIRFGRRVADKFAISNHLDTSSFHILKKNILNHALVNKKNEWIFYVHHIERIMDLALRSPQRGQCCGILGGVSIS